MHHKTKKDYWLLAKKVSELEMGQKERYFWLNITHIMNIEAFFIAFF